MAWINDIATVQASGAIIASEVSYRSMLRIVIGQNYRSETRTTYETIQATVTALTESFAKTLAEDLSGDHAATTLAALGISVGENMKVSDAVAERMNDAGAWRVKITVESITKRNTKNYDPT